MLSPVGLTDNQSDFKLQLDRIVEREREAHQNGNPPKGACLIHVPDYQPYFYTDLTPRAARAAANPVGAKYRFKFGGRG